VSDSRLLRCHGNPMIEKNALYDRFSGWLPEIK
jgi:hypothetical protein